MNTIQRITEYVQAHRQEIIRDLSALASIPSIEGKAQPGAPFGPECARVMETAAKLYRDYGFEATLYPDSGYALATYGDGEKYLGVFGHLDVVPVTPADWIVTSPFDIIEKDGYLYGRGVHDNKAGCIATLYAMRAIRDLNLPLRNRIVAFMGTNEESGMEDVKAFAGEQPLPAASIIPDSGYPVSLGEMGIMRIDLKSELELQDVLALEGGQAYNIVLPLLKCSLRKNPVLAQELRACTEEWLELSETDGTLDLIVKGIAAHAAGPENGVSALKRLSELLVKCEGLNTSDRAQFRAIAHALADHNGHALGIAFTDERLGALTSANGIVRIEDGHLLFTLDIRCGTLLTHEEIAKRVEAAVSEGGFKGTVRDSSAAFSIDENHPMAQAMLNTFRTITGKTESKPFYMKGGTYCKYLPNAFSTNTCTAGIEAANLPFGHGGAHQADECLNIEGFYEGIVILTAMALALDALI